MNNSFERLEKWAFHSYWDDGLLDVMIGFVLVAIGISWWLDAFIWGVFFLPLCASLARYLVTGLPLLAGGAIILIIGVTIMVRFMASNPLEPGATA
jgi:hypothetical protein